MTAYKELYDKADEIMKKRGYKGGYKIITEEYGSHIETPWGEIIELDC